jgi:hypothetical protein
MADLIFSEDFGNISDGTNIETSNSNFDYRRIGSGGGAIVSTNPSNFTQAAMSLGGASAGSLNGVGLSSGLGSSNFVGLSFNFRSADVSQGNLIITTGSDPNFGNNNTFSTSQLFFGVQFDAGNVEYRSSSWNNTGFSLSNNTDYKIEIYGNNTGAEVDYGSGSVANHRLDILINGTNIADDVSFSNNQLVDGFRIYQINGGQTYEIDDITLVDGNFSSVPEPTSLLIFGGNCVDWAATSKENFACLTVPSKATASRAKNQKKPVSKNTDAAFLTRRIEPKFCIAIATLAIVFDK